MHPLKEKEIAADRNLLQELAAQEHQIWEQVRLAAGSASGINLSLKQRGLFERYREIYEQYLMLASFKKDRQTRNEALKRALFLGWYQEVEPPAFTALADLDEDKVTEVYFVLNKLIEKGWLQDEFLWMLAHYARWDWVILQFTENKIHQVTRWVKGAEARLHCLPLGRLPKGSMQNRGLMGRYFQELGVEVP